MNLEVIKQELRQHKNRDISKATGVCLDTISSIKSGRNQYPTTRTVEKLRAFLEKANVIPSISQKSAA